MADYVFENPFFSLNAVDYSSKVRSLTLRFGRDAVEKTAGGDGMHVNLNGIKNWRLEATLKEDYAAGGLDAAIFALVNAGSSFAIAVRPVNSAISTSNPEYQGTGIMDGDYPLIGGSIGELGEKEIAVVPFNGTFVRDETP